MNLLKNIRPVLIITGVLLLLFSCKKDLTELNVNPDQPLSTNPDYLFCYVLQQGMGNYNSDVTLKQWAIENWIMYLAARNGFEPGKAYVIPGGKDDFWREQYTNTLANTQLIIDMANHNPEMVNIKSAAVIWKVRTFQMITDLWGDVPYSSALQGMSTLAFTPAYDQQQDIYRAMIEELQEAVSAFDPGKKFFASGSDIIFNGDVEKWKALGNSLLLRVATRMNKVDYQTYANVVENLKGKPLISDNNGTAVLRYNSVAKNHLWETMYRNESTVQNNPSDFFVKLMVNSNDPRIHIFFEKAPLSFLPFIPSYKGVPNLLPENDPAWENYNLNADLGVEGEWGDVSRIGKWFLNNNTPGVVMAWSEVCFLKAEAALNGLLDEDAGVLLAQGIRANMEFFNLYSDESNRISESEINEYLLQLPEVNLEQIIVQKWISFAYEQGYDAYAEYRRTGYPVLKNYQNQPVNPAAFPRRITYPYSEFTLNRDNYNKAIETQGPDNEFTRVWWDMNESTVK